MKITTTDSIVVADTAVVRRVAATPVAVLAEVPLIAEGLGTLLDRTRLFDVVAATTDPGHVVALVARGAVRVVVFGGAGTGFDQLARAQLDVADAAATHGHLVATVQVLSPSVYRWGRTGDLGASAVVATDEGVDGLARAVFQACRNRRPGTIGSYRRPNVALSAATQRSPLTPRELEVLQGIADGLRSKDIAERLGVSVHTVRTHVQRLLPKLGAHTRLRATAVAFEEGLVTRKGLSHP